MWIITRRIWSLFWTEKNVEGDGVKDKINNFHHGHFGTIHLFLDDDTPMNATKRRFAHVVQLMAWLMLKDKDKTILF